MKKIILLLVCLSGCGEQQPEPVSKTPVGKLQSCEFRPRTFHDIPRTVLHTESGEFLVRWQVPCLKNTATYYCESSYAQWIEIEGVDQRFYITEP